MLKLKRGLQACRLKHGGGVRYKLRYQTKQKCICHKIIIKKHNRKAKRSKSREGPGNWAISSFIFRQLYIIKHIC